MNRKYPNKRLSQLKSIALFSLFSFSFSLSIGCSQINYEDAGAMVELARDLGANVRVRGELGPASFGQVFQADLGARLKIEGETNTNSVSTQQLLEINQRLIDLLEHLLHQSPERKRRATHTQQPSPIAMGAGTWLRLLAAAYACEAPHMHGDPEPGERPRTQGIHK